MKVGVYRLDLEHVVGETIRRLMYTDVKEECTRLCKKNFMEKTALPNNIGRNSVLECLRVCMCPYLCLCGPLCILFLYMYVYAFVYVCVRCACVREYACMCHLDGSMLRSVLVYQIHKNVYLYVSVCLCSVLVLVIP